MSKGTKFIICYGAILGVTLIGFMIWRSVFWEWVPTGKVAIVYNRSSGVQRGKVLTPGRHTLAPLDSLIEMPTNIVTANYTADRDFEGNIKAGESIDITTTQSTIPFDVLVLYRVKNEDVWKVFDNFARQTTDQIQATRIRREIKNVANVVSGKFNLEELTGRRRDEANVIFKQELTAALAPLGFTVEEAFFVTAYPNDQLSRQFVNLEIADLQRQIASFHAESAKREKEIAIIKAEAEQRAAQIVANSMTPKAKAIQDLDNQIAYWKRWDGSNVVVDTTNLTSVYVSPSVLGQGGK